MPLLKSVGVLLVNRCEEQFVELDGALVLLVGGFVDGQAHRHAHPEILRRLQAAAVVMDQVTVINRLQAHVCKSCVTFDAQSGGDPVEVEGQQAAVEPAEIDALAQVIREVRRVARGEAGGVLVVAGAPGSTSP